MHIRLTIAIWVLVTSHFISFSQFIYYDTSGSTDMGLARAMVDSGRDVRDSLQGLGYSAQTFFIHHVGNKIWMSVDGRFDVFEWDQGKWVKIYKGTYHGYNYGSQKFTYKGKLYSYKGYGFWREHGEIVEFLPEKGGWEIIPDSKGLPYGIGYMTDSTFYIHANNCFTVNLTDQSVLAVPCKYSLRGQTPRGREYVFDDYILITSILDDGAQYPLISKETGDIHLSHRQPFKGIRDARTINSLIHIVGNDMTIIFPDSSSVKYNVENELQYYLIEPKGSRPDLAWYWWVIIGVSLVSILGILTRFYKKPAAKPDSDRLVPFKEYAGKLIDSEELDKILNIQDIIVYDTRKHKRASLISEINAYSQTVHGVPLIERERDPNDKRLFLYRIKSL